MPKASTKNQAKLWQARQFKDVTLLKASFTTYAFRRHSHPEYVVGVIQRGVERFYYQGAEQIAPGNHLITINPEEAHDGSSATDQGYHYRAAYIPQNFLNQSLKALGANSRKKVFFNDPVLEDHILGYRLAKALEFLEYEKNQILAAQSDFIDVILDLVARYACNQTPSPIKKHPSLIKNALDQIRDQAQNNISLDDLANQAQVNKFHFLRVFKKSTGLTPHAFLIQRRVEIAKKMIQEKAELTEAALKAGFSDQSHMARNFKAIYGVTPGSYQANLF